MAAVRAYGIFLYYFIESEMRNCKFHVSRYNMLLESIDKTDMPHVV